jgi:copper oxidase (laccase) domain-containing protein
MSTEPLSPWMTFSLLEGQTGILHGFITRIPGVDTVVDRETAIERLLPHQMRLLEANGFGGLPLATGEQVHRAEVAVLSDGETLPAFPVRGVDALVTNRTDIALGIYVADCAAVYFFDPVKRVLGLAHAGKKGTLAGIAARTLRTMQLSFGSDPADVLAQISPCIRPPHYEVDFANDLRRHLVTEGVRSFEDCGECTAANAGRYYSYRRDKGRTGRMLAVLALKQEQG